MYQRPVGVEGVYERGAAVISSLVVCWPRDDYFGAVFRNPGTKAPAVVYVFVNHVFVNFDILSVGPIVRLTRVFHNLVGNVANWIRVLVWSVPYDHTSTAFGRPKRTVGAFRYVMFDYHSTR